MKVLEITEANAKKYYKSASQEFRQELIDHFGETFFSEKITDRVKTWEDVCLIKGQDPIQCLPYPNAKISEEGEEVSMEEWLNNCKKLADICEVLNEEWRADYSNPNQRKYFAVFKYTSSGFGFSFVGDDGRGSNAAVGSRFVLRSPEITEYAARQFEKEYNKFLLG